MVSRLDRRKRRIERNTLALVGVRDIAPCKPPSNIVQLQTTATIAPQLQSLVSIIFLLALTETQTQTPSPPVQTTSVPVQQFRSWNREASIETHFDLYTDTRVVLWKHIKKSFPGVLQVRADEVDVNFMVDDTLEDLEPLRILYRPDKVLTVVLKNEEPPCALYPSPYSRCAREIKRDIFTVQAAVESSHSRALAIDDSLLSSPTSPTGNHVPLLSPLSLNMGNGEVDLSNQLFDTEGSHFTDVEDRFTSEVLEPTSELSGDTGASTQSRSFTFDIDLFLEQKTDLLTILEDYLKVLEERVQQESLETYTGMFALYLEVHMVGDALLADEEQANLVQFVAEMSEDIARINSEYREGEEDAAFICDTILKLQQSAFDQFIAMQHRIQAALVRTYELYEEPIPRLFIILRKEALHLNTVSGTDDKFRLYFFCDCVAHSEHSKQALQETESGDILHHVHLAEHGGYDLMRPNELIVKYGPYLLTMLEMFKYGARTPSVSVLPLRELTLSNDAEEWENGDISRDNIESRVNDTIDYLESLLGLSNSGNLSMQQVLDVADLCEVESFLDAHKLGKALANLYRTVASTGDVKWVCERHFDNNFDTLYTELDKQFGRIKFFHEFDEQWPHGPPWIEPGVHELYLEKCEIQDIDVLSLCNAVLASNVRIFSLHSTRYDNSFVDSRRGTKLDLLVRLMTSDRLQAFSMTDCVLLDRGAALEGPPIPQLKMLELDVRMFTATIRESLHKFLQRLPNLAHLSLACEAPSDVYIPILEWIQSTSLWSSLSTLKLSQRSENAIFVLNLRSGAVRLSLLSQDIMQIIEDNSDITKISLPFDDMRIASDIYKIDGLYDRREIPLTVTFTGNRKETLFEMEFLKLGDTIEDLPVGRRFRGDASDMYMRWPDDGELKSKATLDFSTLTTDGILGSLRALSMAQMDSLHIICCDTDRHWRPLIASSLDPNPLSRLLRLELQGKQLDMWIEDLHVVIRREYLQSLQGLCVTGIQARLTKKSLHWIKSMLMAPAPLSGLRSVQLKGLKLGEEDWRMIISTMVVSSMRSLDFSGSSIQRDQVMRVLNKMREDAPLEYLVLDDVSWVQALAKSDPIRLLLLARPEAESIAKSFERQGEYS
ncbi:hypothetical protein EDD21DRAFT_403528 [Dissophora ornata]|nr:hypothetical protein EDD21DRAFT_403528 [Dissophora ornata]